MGQKHITNEQKKLNQINISNEIKGNNNIVIGIDFGSSGITFAYCFLDDPNKLIYPGKFEDQGKNKKISNEIILDENLENVICFGNECKTFLSTNFTDKSPKFHHFKKIKMNLYKRKYKIKAINSGKEADIQFKIKKILEEVKSRAIKQIKLTHLFLEENNIHWTITVPAIWENKSKQIMINAALEAGLISDNEDPSKFFTLEPEAALIYYFSSPLSSYNDKPKIEYPFILCDLGSGTADIVIEKRVISDNQIKFEELYPPIGGDDGCNIINENFMDRVIKKLFGEKCFNDVKEDICKNNYFDWVEFENKIEEFKKSYTSLNKLDLYFQIDCEIFKNYCNQDLEELIEIFISNHPNWKLKSERNWKILFSYQIIHDLMSELIDNILNK